MKAVDVVKALADETRLRLVYILRNRDMCVCELETILGLSQPNVSRHLKALKNAGLVGSHRAGQWIHYWINPEFLTTYPDFWSGLVTLLELSEDPYATDQQMYTSYETSGWTCQDLKTDKDRIMAEIAAMREMPAQTKLS
jgi:ArsR family transcriptional regulator, arsenate/arsenite/antimonite-responsive transcriptional repressor